ncbi:MAG TPA: hypothetical protein VHV47_02165 [Opitutaceae bacterium]|nr:hypothetical protein [Opitutaceae bacterium]
MSFLFRLSFLLPLLAVGPLRADVPAALAAPKPDPNRPLWQQRRDQFFAAVRGVESNDPQQSQVFGAILGDFQDHPLNRTPMENMDILGVFFIPREGAEKWMTAVVMNAILGWYDALRFGTDAGRKVIVEDDRFFIRAFALGGTDSFKKSMDYIRGNPDKVSAAVDDAVNLATQSRDKAAYDQHWPADFAGAGGKGFTLPVERWNEAWEAAVERARAYYVIRAPHPSPPPSPPAPAPAHP